MATKHPRPETRRMWHLQVQVLLCAPFFPKGLALLTQATNLRTARFWPKRDCWEDRLGAMPGVRFIAFFGRGTRLSRTFPGSRFGSAFRLPNYHGIISKRLIRMPTLHFYDTGLARWLPGHPRGFPISRAPVAGFASFSIRFAIFSLFKPRLRENNGCH